MFIGLLSVCIAGISNRSLTSSFKGSIKRVSLSNRPNQARPRPRLVNITSNETLFYPFTVGINKCGGGCNNIVHTLE